MMMSEWNIAVHIKGSRATIITSYHFHPQHEALGESFYYYYYYIPSGVPHSASECLIYWRVSCVVTCITEGSSC